MRALTLIPLLVLAACSGGDGAAPAGPAAGASAPVCGLSAWWTATIPPVRLRY